MTDLSKESSKASQAKILWGSMSLFDQADIGSIMKTACCPCPFVAEIVTRIGDEKVKYGGTSKRGLLYGWFIYLQTLLLILFLESIVWMKKVTSGSGIFWSILLTSYLVSYCVFVPVSMLVAVQVQRKFFDAGEVEQMQDIMTQGLGCCGLINKELKFSKKMMKSKSRLPEAEPLMPPGQKSLVV